MNAKDELVKAVRKAGTEIECARIEHGFQYDDEDPVPVYRLRAGHTPDELRQFLRQLDFVYDAGYGGQELYGTVWLKDGTWMERGEYDGSEWWEHKVRPPIPMELTEGD